MTFREEFPLNRLANGTKETALAALKIFASSNEGKVFSDRSHRRMIRLFESLHHDLGW